MHARTSPAVAASSPAFSPAACCLAGAWRVVETTLAAVAATVAGATLAAGVVATRVVVAVAAGVATGAVGVAASAVVATALFAGTAGFGAVETILAPVVDTTAAAGAAGLSSSCTHRECMCYVVRACMRTRADILSCAV